MLDHFSFWVDQIKKFVRINLLRSGEHYDLKPLGNLPEKMLEVWSLLYVHLIFDPIELNWEHKVR